MSEVRYCHATACDSCGRTRMCAQFEKDLGNVTDCDGSVEIDLCETCLNRAVKDIDRHIKAS